jgi:outer membrane protein
MSKLLSRSFPLTCLLGIAAGALAQTGASVPNAPSVGGAATAAAAVPAGPTKIAIIQFQPAVAQTNEGQRDFAEIRKKYEPKQAQLKQQSDEVDNLKKQMQTAGTTLSDTERASRLRTIDEKEKSLQRAGEDAQNDYQQEVQQTFGQVAEKVFQVVQAYATQNGYTVVIDASQQQSPVLWFNQGTDISAAVVQAYNQKSGIPAPAASSSGTPSAPSATPRPRTTTTTPH